MPMHFEGMPQGFPYLAIEDRRPNDHQPMPAIATAGPPACIAANVVVPRPTPAASAAAVAAGRADAGSRLKRGTESEPGPALGRFRSCGASGLSARNPMARGSLLPEALPSIGDDRITSEKLRASVALAPATLGRGNEPTSSLVSLLGSTALPCNEELDNGLLLPGAKTTPNREKCVPAGLFVACCACVLHSSSVGRRSVPSGST
jgi:hypothetical protein